MPLLSRRLFVRHALTGAAALGAAGLLTRTAGAGPVIVVGGGPAGAAAAVAMRRADAGRTVILIERDPSRLARPAAEPAPAAFMRPGTAADFDALRAAGVEVMLDDVTAVDWSAGRLELFSGRRPAFDALVMAPGSTGVDEAIPGLDAAARHLWPAAWGSDREARRLAGQLAAMPAAGHVVLRLPAGPGGYAEVAAARAATLAAILERTRPAARLTVLDADSSGAARERFAGLAAGARAARIDWRGPAEGGIVLAVDAPKGEIESSAGRLAADVVNFVTPQAAAPVAALAGLVDASGWCPCGSDARSLLKPQAVVLGDARKGAVRTVPAALADARIAVAAMART